MRLRIIAALVVVLSLLLAPAAVAQTRTKTGPSGDSPAAIDLTKLTATNSATRVTMRVKVRNLTHKGVFGFGFGGDTTGVFVELKWLNGGPAGKLKFCGEEDCVVRKCPGLRKTWNARKNFIQVSIPQGCYSKKKPRAWDIGVYAQLNDKIDGITIFKLRAG